MSFLAPAYLFAAAGLAGLVVALHLIATREPATVPLPTARFAPDRPVRARTRTMQLRDVLLLLCRAGLILAAGAALARPIPASSRQPLARIVVADNSSSVADAAAVRDSLRALLSPGDALIRFDSTAALVARGTDTLPGPPTSRTTGSLSAALVVALRTAVSLRDAADSLELILVSAFGVEERDQATDSIRGLWPGAIRLVRVAGRRDSSAPRTPAFLGAAADPLRYALSPAPNPAEGDVRLVRATPTGADSTWAAGGPRTLVLWPAAQTEVGSDTVGAVSAGDFVVVAPFARDARRVPGVGRVAARWLDGTPAAVEVRHGDGCIRTVEIPVPSVGDLVLDPRFQGLASRLTEPCGTRPSFEPLDDAHLAALAGTGRSARVPARAMGRARVLQSPLAPWLLAAALGLGLGELLLRRKRAVALAEAPS